MNKSKSLKIIVLAVIVLFVLVIGLFIGKMLPEGEKENTAKNNTTADTDNFKQIRINEDFSKDGTVENLENVRWNNANIMQFDNEMEISIYLNNESQTEVVPERQLTVNLLDKNGKVMYTQDVMMKEIAAEYGYTTIDLKFEIQEVAIIHDIQIIAK